LATSAAELQLILGRRHRSVLLEEFARQVGHLELLLDVHALLFQRGNHVALLALDRNLAFGIAFVDDHRKVEFVGRDFLFGTSVHLDIARKGFLHLRRDRQCECGHGGRK